MDARAERRPGQAGAGGPVAARVSGMDRVRAALAGLGIEAPRVLEFTQRTATAAEAAAAIGTGVERIVKSLVFLAGDRPVLVLVSGPNRVDTHKLGERLGEAVTRASAEQVRQLTGFAVGGIPPVGHARSLATYVDADLLQYDQVWAAAGTPNAVFSIAPRELVRITRGQVMELAQAR